MGALTDERKMPRTEHSVRGIEEGRRRLRAAPPGGRVRGQFAVVRLRARQQERSTHVEAYGLAAEVDRAHEPGVALEHQDVLRAVEPAQGAVAERGQLSADAQRVPVEPEHR